MMHGVKHPNTSGVTHDPQRDIVCLHYLHRLKLCCCLLFHSSILFQGEGTCLRDQVLVNSYVLSGFLAVSTLLDTTEW